jgi:hypothetical protein
MRRREFLGALGGAGTWALNARAQQSLPFIPPQMLAIADEVVE